MTDTTTTRLSRAVLENDIKMAREGKGTSAHWNVFRLAEATLAYMTALEQARRHFQRIEAGPQGWLNGEYIGIPNMAMEGRRIIDEVLL